MQKIVIRVDPERRQWWKQTMSELLPEYEFVLWDEDDFDKGEIIYAITWSPPAGALASLPNLKAVFSVGAGISHITDDPSYPRHVPIIRTTGERLRQRMCEYITLHVLRIHRRLPEIEAASARREWKQFVEPVASNVVVGLMGVGNLGGAVASSLQGLGYSVRGLTREGKPRAGLEVFPYGEISQFLAGVNILISILPGTPETENIVRSEHLTQLPDGAWVINVGRGSQVNDEDLLAALDTGKLAGAVLDVFRREPLPSEHPFWAHPKILITSHTASAIEPAVGGEIIAKNIRDFVAGAPVADLVDMDRGY
jgi:glyoxylate/hydroxypyruvate reductase A